MNISPTLPLRMMQAAETIDELNDVYTYGPNRGWDTASIRGEIVHVQADLERSLERDRIVEQLAREMWATEGLAALPTPGDLKRGGHLSTAHALVAAGWRKAGDE